ncbi:MAG: class I SAM-dependent methyltransferase [Dehalococcoidia bacterium]|nr:class I SAM-dependent methyltransferase [Dehalococcoidia bacterium]
MEMKWIEKWLDLYPTDLLGRASRNLRTLLSPPPVVYISRKGKISRFVQSLGEQSKVVDIGSGSARRAGKIVNLDIFRFPNVDVVFDGRHLPIRDASIDGIISTAVLEHVEDSPQFVAEMFRVLKEGGKILVTVPFIEGYHESPSDFQRYTLNGLDVLFHRFIRIDSGVECGPSSALAWILRAWLASFGTTRRSHELLMLIGGWLVQPIKYADIFLADRPFAHNIAAGLFFVGEKPSTIEAGFRG